MVAAGREAAEVSAPDCPTAAAGAAGTDPSATPSGSGSLKTPSTLEPLLSSSSASGWEKTFFSSCLSPGASNC